MKENKLVIGTTFDDLEQTENKFLLPIEAVVQRFAFLGISGAGKTCAATVLAEEFCKLKIPWIAYDPTGVWWGLRYGAGSHTGYPIVVIGGQHGDLPLEKNKGQQIAEALISENVCAVIDVKAESKTTWRKFLTEFSLRLLDFSPDIPRHIFIEETSDFAPQKTRVRVTAECKEAIERLVRTGRNNGYGSSLILQRPATVDKDILSQVGNLFVLRTIGKHDRKSLYEWMESNWPDHKAAKMFLDKLPKLDDGHGWFWSPQWMKTFLPFKTRIRETHHPGETRKLTKTNVPGELADATEFIERLKRQLQKKVVSVQPVLERGSKKEYDGIEKFQSPESTKRINEENAVLTAANMELKKQLLMEKDRRSAMESKLAAVKQLLLPQYEQLKTVFAEIGDGAIESIVVGDYAMWLQKLSGSPKRMLQAFIEKNEFTKQQLQIFLGLSKESVRTAVGRLTSAGLVKYDKGSNKYVLQKI